MDRRIMIGAAMLVSIFSITACGMMASMMGMGDKWDAMINMDQVMDEQGMDVQKIMANRQEQERIGHARGAELFMDTALGKNDLSCNSCHPGGASAKKMAGQAGGSIPGLEGAAAQYPKYDPASKSVITLAMRNNNCLRLYMDGKGLALTGWDASALAQYVTAFSNGKEVR